MKTRPIIFSGPMVRAILDGKKTQTRRVMKPQPNPITKGPADSKIIYTSGWFEGGDVPDYVLKRCPFGVPGERLLVREQHQIMVADSAMKYGEIDYDEIDYKTGKGLRVVYCATDEIEEFYNEDQERDSSATRPSIFMPRWASRIALEITGVRVERVQDISDEDILFEGFKMNNQAVFSLGYKPAFKRLWDSINSKRGFGWDANPWIWVIEFKRVSK
jgi:hypothetical protein